MSFIHDLASAALGRLDPETAHRLAIRGLKAGLGPKDDGPDDPILSVELAGLALPNCIGLAAGFDKHAEVPGAMLAAGFGLVECGTVTPLQSPKSRCVGRRDIGREIVRERPEALQPGKVVLSPGGGVLVGADVRPHHAARGPAAQMVGEDVQANAVETVAIDHGLVLGQAEHPRPGISRLRQGRGALDDLLGRLAEARATLAARHGQRPVFLKVAPDLFEPEIDDICASVQDHGLNGIIVGNTTLSRPEGLASPRRGEAGGLSGAPLFDLSTRVLGQFHARTQGRLVLIGCGGVGSGADAYAKIRAGACAVQLYTLMSIRGAGLVATIKRDLAARVRADGFARVVDAVGTAQSA